MATATQPSNTTKTTRTRARKTAGCVASLGGRLPAAVASFEHAMASDGQWWLRITRHTKYGDERTAWTAVESPLPALGVDPGALAGDVAWHHRAPVALDALPGLQGWGEPVEIFITGDIGHRYRLPKSA